MKINAEQMLLQHPVLFVLIWFYCSYTMVVVEPLQRQDLKAFPNPVSTKNLCESLQ